MEVEHAFTTKSEKLQEVNDAARLLTSKRLLASKDALTLDGPRVATSPREIRALALDYNRVITNVDDAMNVIEYVDRDGGGGGGHADDRSLRLLANGLGMDNLEIVREIVVEGDTLLMGIEGGSTALAGLSMVMWQPGHWSAVASNVSSLHFTLPVSFRIDKKISAL